MIWFAPSVETVIGAGHVAMLEDPAVQVKLTVVLVLFQPAPLAAGDMAALIVGGVELTTGVTEVVPLYPPV